MSDHDHVWVYWTTFRGVEMRECGNCSRMERQYGWDWRSEYAEYEEPFNE